LLSALKQTWRRVQALTLHEIYVSFKPVALKCAEIHLPVRMCCAVAWSRAVLGPNTPL